MSAAKMQNTLNDIEQNMSELAPYRRPELFNQFLVKGYTAVTLSSVPQTKFSQLLQAKLCLGTLITLYDDFADRPSQSNPELLQHLYQLNFEKHDPVRFLSSYESQVLNFAISLLAQMKEILLPLPHYQGLSEILKFDLLQFYSANQYSSLLTARPYLNNPSENRLYTHHNMGMVMVAMMDLMASEKIEFSEFGDIREVFLMGQRMGRIFNVLTTRQREVSDRDITGELAVYKNQHEVAKAEFKLREEISDLHNKILSFDKKITTFSVKAYLEGLTKVQKLHEQMEGLI
ncbi:MAG: hypothetical protein NDI63_12020 [Pseudobdellovibrio sp.]|nr:hypothetical protein [Pseudobdellovibrio sp.]